MRIKCANRSSRELECVLGAACRDCSAQEPRGQGGLCGQELPPVPTNLNGLEFVAQEMSLLLPVLKV